MTRGEHTALPARLVGVTLSAAVALTLAGCGGADKPTSGPTKVDTAIPPPTATGGETFGGQSLDYTTLTKLSKTLSTAVAGNDAKTLVGLVAPGHPRLVEQQRRWLRNVHAVDMSIRKMVVVRPDASIDSSGKGVLTAFVGFVHAIRGADRRPVAEWYSYGFQKQGSALKVVSVKGAPADGDSAGQKFSRYYRQSWDDPAPITQVADDKVVILGPSADRGAMQRLLPSVSGAVRSQLRTMRAAGTKVDPSVWSRRWVFNLASPDVPDFFDYYGGEIDRREAAFEAFTKPILSSSDAQGASLDYEKGTLTSRIVLNRRVLTDSGVFVATTIRHELVHAVQQTWETNGDSALPVWATEGLAVYLSDPGSSERSYRIGQGLSALNAAKVMPSNRTFYDGGDTAVARNYGLGYLAVGYLGQTVGKKRLLAAVRASESTGGGGFFDELGVPERGFVGRVQAWAAKGGRP